MYWVLAQIHVDWVIWIILIILSLPNEFELLNHFLNFPFDGTNWIFISSDYARADRLLGRSVLPYKYTLCTLLWLTSCNKCWCFADSQRSLAFSCNYNSWLLNIIHYEETIYLSPSWNNITGWPFRVMLCFIALEGSNALHYVGFFIMTKKNTLWVDFYKLSGIFSLARSERISLMALSKKILTLDHLQHGEYRVSNLFHVM